MKPKLALITSVFASVVAITIGCATNPATGRRQLILMSEAEEVQIGRQNDAQVRKEMGLYGDQNLQRYVNDIGQRLVTKAHRPQLPWTFAVVDEPAVNAFALPGGFIYLTRGILPYLRNEAELAGVLGHEIGHVDARHSAEAYSKQLGAGLGLAVASILSPTAREIGGAATLGLEVLFLKYGRDAELESDRLGVGYSASSGWDPRGVPGLLNTLGRLDEASGSRRGIPNWTLTHPPAADRVTRVQEAVAAAPPATTTNAAALERFLDGMVFGDSREKGLVRDNEFVHPILRFGVRFPAGWEVINTDAQVMARQGEESNVAMVLQPAKLSGGSLQQAVPASMATSGWTLVDGARTSINGLEAFVGTYQGVRDNTRISVQAAHIRAGDQTYVVAGVAPASQFNGAANAFRNAIRTFRPLTREEADSIRANRVDFYVARNGDTWDAIARGPSGNHVKASTLAIMNGHTPTEQPRSGERLRIVVGD